MQVRLVGLLVFGVALLACWFWGLFCWLVDLRFVLLACWFFCVYCVLFGELAGVLPNYNIRNIVPPFVPLQGFKV